MTTDRHNEEINQAYIGTSYQQSLFNTHPREVCNEIGLNWLTALELRDKGWLSFDPEANPELEEPDKAELRFVGSLVAWGFDESQLGMILDGLRKPYRYKIESMYFDWLAREWRILPLPPKSISIDDVQEFIETLDQEEDVHILLSLHEQLSEALGIRQRRTIKKKSSKVSK